MIKISSSILSVDNNIFEEEIKDAVKAGSDYIHIDVMDGKFVNNYTNGIEMIRKTKNAASILLDVHLMVENPQDYIDDFLDANIITFHVEAATEEIARKIIKKLHEKNIKVGMSIKPKTKIEEIKKYIDDIDMVLVMTVEPGFGGQALIPDTIKKIEDLRKINSKIDIEVDGGINLETARMVKNAGANILVPGTALFNSENKKLIIEEMKKQ